MHLDKIREAVKAQSLCEVGQVAIFMDEKIAELGRIDVGNCSKEQAIEKIISLDPMSLVSLSFDIAENWKKDHLDGLALLRKNDRGEFYPDDYCFVMAPSPGALGLTDYEIAQAQKVSVITGDVLDKAETSDQLPLSYDVDREPGTFPTVAWRISANRSGVTREYICAVHLWSFISK